MRAPLLIWLFAPVFGCSALLAADLGHGAVALLARSGLISSRYLAYSHDTVTPTLITALLLGAVFFMLICGEAFARAARLRDDWLAYVASWIGKTRTLRFAPAVFAAQLLVLFAMESAEQFVAFGHPLGFVASLGAPVVIAFIVHALAAFFVVTAVSLACRWLTFTAGAIADALRPVLQRLSAPTASPAPQLRRLITQARAGLRRLAPLARRAANRPPPFQLIAA